MPRKPNVEPIARLHIKIPASIRGWLEAELWSDLEQRVPVGAFQNWFLERVEEQKNWGTLQLAPYGFPPEAVVRAPEWVLYDLQRKLEKLTENPDVHS